MQLIQYFEQTPAIFFILEGEDALDFAQAQCSQDLSGTLGGAREALWLDHKGKLHARTVVLVESAERVVIVSAKGDSHHLQAKLDRHIIADDVDIETGPPDWKLIEMEGEQLEERVKSLGYELPEPGKLGRWGAGYVWRGGWFGKQSLVYFGMSCPVGILENGQRLAEDEANRLRIENGYVLIPEDLDDSSTPAEGPLMEAVSFDKGCYLGQEVVARMQRLDRIPRKLYRFCLSGAARCEKGMAVEVDGQEIGTVRCVVKNNDSQTGFALVKESRFAGTGNIGGVPATWETLE